MKLDARTTASLLLAASLVTAGCGGPFFVFPGGALRGELADGPVDDWSFASDRFVDLETRPAAPYSVELNYFLREEKLYIDPAEGRTWLEYIREDPRVRVRFDGKVYLGTAVLVEDPEELTGFDPERIIYRIDGRSE